MLAASLCFGVEANPPTIATEDGYLFVGYDTLGYPSKPANLIAKVLKMNPTGLTGINDVTVGFYHKGKLAGLAKTNDKGEAAISYTPAKAGSYKFDLRAIAADDGEGEGADAIEKLTTSSLLLVACPKDKPLVVIDLDHTVVDSSFLRVLFGEAKPMADAVRVTKRIAGKYGIIYLTARPDLLAGKSKAWLAEHGFPSGPLLLSGVEKMFASGKFKTAKLSALQEAFPNIAIGIGDKYSDAQAYVDNSMTAYLIPVFDRDKVKSLQKTVDKLSRLDGNGRLKVVSNWKEIEAGIFEGLPFKPEDFIGQLQTRIDELQTQDPASKN